MKVKCEYCGNYMQDTEDVCPHCGAPNDHQPRSGSGVPKTIEELKRFCAARSLPLAKMRFFIGQDYREPRAFGIYRDEEGLFVVYKNKADGSRAVRYRGTDEAYAVNEIYQKLKTEIANQREYQASRGSTRSSGGSGRKMGPALIAILGVIVVLNILISTVFGLIRGSLPDNGYYTYNGSTYYNQNDVWYGYDDTSYGWVPVVVDEELADNASDYYSSSYYNSDYGVEDFSDSSYYVEPDYDSDWDDDDDWDWGDSDWDSGGSDWDSDW